MTVCICKHPGSLVCLDCFMMSENEKAMAEDDPLVSFNDSESVGASNPKRSRRNRKKVTTEWSEEATITLIAAVESQDFLWNVDNKDYKNRIMRNTVWEEMSENIFSNEYDVAQLQAKWSNLRIQFKFYNSKVSKKKNYEVTWKYYGRMMFLTGAGEEQPTESESNLMLDMEQESSSSTHSTTAVNPKSKKTESNDDLKMVPLDGMRCSTNKVDGYEDSFQTFGNFVASELRKIPDAAVANKIQRTLTRNLMDLLDDAESDLVLSSQQFFSK